MKKLSEKGVTIIEALVATAIIGIGFVAVFQMVQYSVSSIDVSGQRTKATYLSGMIAEDLYAEKNQETTAKKFMDVIAETPWKLEKCDNSNTANISLPDFGKNHAIYKKEKWSSRLSKDYIKCRPSDNKAGTVTTKDKKSLTIFKICHDINKCDGDTNSKGHIQKSNLYDSIYIGRSEVNMHGGTKMKVLYFQVK